MNIEHIQQIFDFIFFDLTLVRYSLFAIQYGTLHVLCNIKYVWYHTFFSSFLVHRWIHEPTHESNICIFASFVFIFRGKFCTFNSIFFIFPLPSYVPHSTFHICTCGIITYYFVVCSIWIGKKGWNEAADSCIQINHVQPLTEALRVSLVYSILYQVFDLGTIFFVVRKTQFSFHFNVFDKKNFA